MTTTRSANESSVQVRGTEVQMFSGGSGPALLYIHGAGGNSGWAPYHEELARNYTVYAPSLPGFNGTARPGWVSTITDVAHFTQDLAGTLGLERYILMGSSMGGWVAAEMAAMGDSNIRGLVLIDAAGIKPQNSEISEIFMVGSETRLQQRFYDTSQVENYEQYARELTPEEANQDHANREMASRLCWRPYLHNPSLPHYLGKVSTPALVVWGRQDAGTVMQDRRFFVTMASAALGSAMAPGGTPAARAAIGTGVKTGAKSEKLEHPFGVQHIYYQGPTNELSVFEGGSLQLKPGMEPHPPHKHPEEEILLVTEGSGEISVEGKVTKVRPGSMMYTNANELHGIKCTGSEPLLFYYFKWLKA